YWRRHYDSSKNGLLGALGWGHTHGYDRTLHFDGDGLRYQRPVGQEIGFPPLARDGESCARMGVVLKRISPRQFQIFERGEPALEFSFTNERPVAGLARAFQGKHAIVFSHDKKGNLERIT